jgi:hypothetical protein
MEVSKRARKAVDVTLDAEVWGKLQDHISLHVVYDKLSHKDLLRLRLVCKAWNHAALQRLEPKPYFVTIQVGDDEMILNGILYYDVTSEKFSYKRQQRPPLRYEGELAPVVVDGLIFCNHPNIKDEQGVFNVHTKTWHAIPPVPEGSDSKSVCGMVVDTAERPYSFKLVVGSCDKKTQIYDSKSRSWQTLSSQLAGSALEDFRYVTCVCSQGYLYMSLGVELLLMYSAKGDVWTSLQFPSVDKGECEDSAAYQDWLATHALGEWEGRIFTSRDEAGKETVQVWELIDQKSWVEYASMSEEEYGCLMTCSNPCPDNLENMVIVPCFCNGYLLVYNWQYNICQVESLMMLNLATKEWKHVDLPMGTVAVEASDSEEGSDSEEDVSYLHQMVPEVVCSKTAYCRKIGCKDDLVVMKWLLITSFCNLCRMKCLWPHFVIFHQELRSHRLQQGRLLCSLLHQKLRSHLLQLGSLL